VKKHFNNRGFIYIDILIAIIVLSVGLVALMGVFPYITKVRSAADHRTMAERIIHAQFNYLQKSSFAPADQSWTTIDPNEVQTIITTANDPSNGPGNVSMSFTPFLSLVTNIPSQVPTTGTNRVQGVTMTVTWKGANGNQESVTETNYFFTLNTSFSGGLTYVSLSSQ
jgi:type II secretory pathway pseudopilin PulG